MTFIYWGALITIGIAMIGLIYRIIKGPSTPDRVVALDAVGVSLISIIALLSIVYKTAFFMDIILLIGILSFIGTVAFSKFLERGEIFDRDDTFR